MADLRIGSAAAPSGAAMRGYVGDIPYLRHFIRELAPAWLDLVALLWGVEPPDREGGFAWCDLGCGQGVTAAVLAALQPAGHFHGIDVLPGHIDNARRLASALGANNAVFHAADFAAAADMDLPKFDYITAHGVYSWVDGKVRADLRRFVDRHLKPGGLVYLSYNALPGRAVDVPFQRLVRSYGQSLPADSGAQAAAALAFARRLRAMKVPSLVLSPLCGHFTDRKSGHPGHYLAHELMVGHWNPPGVMEVRADMAEIGLLPVGSATLVDNFDAFVLGKAARRILAKIADANLRESVRDLFLDTAFRRDVFVRAPFEIDERERRRRVLGRVFALARPARRVDYHLATPAGRVSFDNPVSRHIVGTLATGPRRLEALVTPAITQRDIVANAMVLASANYIMPVEPGKAAVSAINRLVLDRLETPEELQFLALPCGTALRIGRSPLLRLRDGRKLARTGLAEFLVAHDVTF